MSRRWEATEKVAVLSGLGGTLVADRKVADRKIGQSAPALITDDHAMRLLALVHHFHTKVRASAHELGLPQ
jgi:hypothetical protein